jgi:NAD(P)H dehydrogenase (quinone)
MLLARDHRATEEIVKASGLPWTLLRNGFYHEVFTDQIPSYLQQGAIVGAAGTGRISGATRADLADAAAAALTGDGHAGRTYELGGDEAFTMPELAAELSRQTGRTIPYRTVPVAEYQAMLEGFGLPAPVAEVYADIDRGIEADQIYIDTGDLRELIGRPTTPLSQSIAEALARQ